MVIDSDIAGRYKMSPLRPEEIAGREADAFISPRDPGRFLGPAWHPPVTRHSPLADRSDQ